MEQNEHFVEPPDHLYNGREAGLPLEVLIVGCGLGGLAAAHCLAQAGHNITMIEQSPHLGEVGAGIQVSPNISRLLIRWGLFDSLRALAVQPEGAVFHRYTDGEMVGYSRWGDAMWKEHGAPYYHIHRADLHRMIFELVISSSRVTTRLGCTVKGISPNPTPYVSITLTTGEVLTGDLIVGADGVKSLIKQFVIGRPDRATPTGDAAYRAIVSTEEMLDDPDLKQFVETPEMHIWMGPKRHMMSYCIKSQKAYNLMMLHPDDGSVESWTAEGSADKMRADFADFEPRVQKLLSLVKYSNKWRLMDRAPLESWVHPKGRVVLLGDSAHPMLPYRAQGASMALEDAAVLGNLLSRLTSAAQLPSLLRAYQSIRLARASRTQESSRMNQRIFHLPDGPEQEARDKAMREAMVNELKSQPGENLDNPNQWADRRRNLEQFSYDADEEAEKWWKDNGERLIENVESATRQDEADRSGWWIDDDDDQGEGEEGEDERTNEEDELELDADQRTITANDRYAVKLKDLSILIEHDEDNPYARVVNIKSDRDLR